VAKATIVKDLAGALPGFLISSTFELAARRYFPFFAVDLYSLARLRILKVGSCC
jgi:hypothetical protein